MKNLKLFFLSFVLITGVLTSCTNDEPVIEEQNIDESQAITTSLSALSLQFNSQGDVEPTDNPSGNIVFDFCFDFVYPLNLSYNTGTTVTVNSLEDLIAIIINSNQDLFINGIAFPFDVETYNDDSDAIEIVTINNEDEFIDLLEDCDFDNEFDCECSEEYDPVCVEIEAPDGQSFVVTYPNECYALCDGFTEDDFTENCEDDFNNTGGYECFTFNFPLTIVTDNNETITVNSQAELDTALYNSYYFDFVYPFSVTDDEGEVETIEDEIDFIELLEDCYDDFEDCDCSDEFNPVCVQVTGPTGNIEIFVFPNECFALCEGFTGEDFIECEDNNTGDCTENDYVLNLTQCNHFAYFLNGNDQQAYLVEFSANGTLTITNEDESFSTTGIWEFGATTADGFATIEIDAVADDFDDVWGITGCEAEFLYMFSTSQTFVIDVICE
ncbi:hypothetical protein SAMN04515667_2585 [Formosa sp. Hel1_31_208]|uniref:Kazal-type serine protease inhibitor family protein n=1 Tax=Formosa sp. Hel1_31_208 TaxID=1798225 RepID=UPI00087C3C06|nr:Kazal-type serine protease inhibitor [Formosa sp. Hel1_31_208]SDS62039.1 hypothetical protein SAMN04515667_2585 [Formosa sp. Hel1_31_208]